MNDALQNDNHAAANATINPTFSATFLPLRNWWVEGLRAGLFLPPRTAGRSPTPLQLLLIFVGYLGLEAILSRLNIVGPANFDTQAWLSGWWSLLVFLGLAWWAFPAPDATLRCRKLF